MEKKSVDLEKLKALGLEQLDGVSGGNEKEGTGPMYEWEKRQCKEAYQIMTSDKSVRPSLDDIVLYCSYTVRRVQYDPYIAEYVKTLM